MSQQALDAVGDTRTLASVVEARLAPRIALVMRTAKLIGQDGEYPCIVRDISTTGTKLRLFHEPPPGEYVFLELANGAIYPMQRRWHAGSEAGFRFATPIDVDEFVAEPSDFPRRAIRLRVSCAAQARSGQVRQPVVIVNLSQQGACIDSPIRFNVRQQVSLEIRDLASRLGHVCWRRGNAHGLVFQQRFALEELAELALSLQPFSHPGKTSADGCSGDNRFCA